MNYSDAIDALLKDEPGLTVREVAAQVRCALSTANKWMQRLQVPGQQPS